MDRRSTLRRPFFLGVLAIALMAFAYLWLEGSAVVVDETGGVASAVISNGAGREHRLRQLWSGYFYALPRLEGAIEVRCRDGSTKRAGYVTRHQHTRIRVVGDVPCSGLVESYY